jgi:hypothetical protein
MAQMDYFRRPILAGKNLKRLTSGTIRGALRRTDADGTSALPYFPGVSGLTLIIQTETSTYTATMTGTSISQVITDINTALGVNGTAFDAGGAIGLKTAGLGGAGFIQVTGGTGATLLGFDTSLGRSLRSSGGDVDSAPEANLKNPLGTAFPGVGEDLLAEVFQRGMARLSSNLDVIFSDLMRDSAVMQKVIGATIDGAGGAYFTLPAATRAFNGYISGGSLLSKTSTVSDLAPFFLIVDATTQQATPYKVTNVVVGVPNGSQGSDAATAADTGKNVLGLNLSKFGPTAITAIREGRVVTCTGAGSACVVGDVVQIASATNTNKWSNNGMKWIVEQIVDANNVVLRPLSQASLTQLGITLNDTQPVLELADDLPGGQSYGTLQVFTGSFTTGVSLMVSPPAPIAGTYEVWVAQPLSLRSRQSWIEQRAFQPFAGPISPFLAGSVSQVPLASRRFASGSTGDLFQAQNQAAVVLTKITAAGAIVASPDGTNTTAITATGTGSGAGVSGIGGATNAPGGLFTGGATNGNGVSAQGTGTGTGVSGTGGATSGTGISGIGGAPNGTGIFGQGTGTGTGVAGTGGATSGFGLDGTGGATNGVGVRGTGTGTGAGVSATGGGTSGIGVQGTGGATNGIGVRGIGTGSGAGVSATGGATGVGGAFTGGATSGDGVTGTGAAGNGRGVVGQGQGSGVGVIGTGGATGAGVSGTGGASGAVGVVGVGTVANAGVSGTGQGVGAGVTGQGGANGDGVFGNGGSSNGIGVKGQGGPSSSAGGQFTGGVVNGPGVIAQGTGSASGLQGTGGTTSGDGVVGTGGAPNGRGVVGTGTGAGLGGDFSGGTTSGTGLRGTGGTPNGAGVIGAGTGTGAGVQATGGATSGIGVTGTGGAPNGLGITGLGTGTGTGVQGTGGATNGIGVSGFGTGSGSGVFGQGGATNGVGGNFQGAGTGSGVIGTGGPTNGAGGTFNGAGNGHGVVVTGAGASGAGGVFSGSPGISATGRAGGNEWGGAFGGSGTAAGVSATGGATGPGGEFNPGGGPGAATRGCIFLGNLTANPSGPINGDMWYNSTTGDFMVRRQGVNRTLALV